MAKFVKESVPTQLMRDLIERGWAPNKVTYVVEIVENLVAGPPRVTVRRSQARYTYAFFAWGKWNPEKWSEMVEGMLHDWDEETRARAVWTAIPDWDSGIGTWFL